MKSRREIKQLRRRGLALVSAEVALKCRSLDKLEAESVKTETPLLRKILIRLSELGSRVFRNQVGSYQLPDGRWLSSGLCIGSSDLIGWTPVTVTPAMVGTTVAVFTAIETKVGKRATTVEQAKFLARVRDAGGIGVVARSIEDAELAVTSMTHSDIAR